VDIPALLERGRGFSLLEAYFRVVQRSTPARAHQFSRAFGPITVVDRSPTLALHADVLYAMLPEHRAVLLLRDPLAQLASWRQRSASAAPGWPEQPLTLKDHCAHILSAWLTPLRAAPAGQLLVLRADALERGLEDGLARIWAFLGLPWRDPAAALERREPIGGVCNPVYAQELEELDRLCWAEISSGSAWLATEAEPPPAGQGRGSSGGPRRQVAPLSASEREAARALFAPLRPLLGPSAAAGDAGGDGRRRASEAPGEGLEGLVPQVEEMLERLAQRSAEAPLIPHQLDGRAEMHPIGDQ
jgi:hypothetical protein